MAGFMAENIEAGLVKQFHWDQVADLPRDGSVTLLDARTPHGVQRGLRPGVCEHPGGRAAPAAGEIDPQKPAHVMCHRADCGAIWPAASWPSTGMTATTLRGYRFYASVMLDQLAAQSACPLRGGAITPGTPGGEAGPGRKEVSSLDLPFLGERGGPSPGPLGGGLYRVCFR